MLRENVRCSYWAHWIAPSGLVLLELFSLGVTAESLRAKRDRKSAISLQRGQFDTKFQLKAGGSNFHAEGNVPYNHFCKAS